MSTKRVTVPKVGPVPPRTPDEWRASGLLRQYGCGPIPFAGSENAFYDRHLVFDRVIDPRVATARERFEALSHSIRDVLAQRWGLTRSTYNKANSKRIYHLSMEFLVGRSLTNHITNLLLNQMIPHAVKEKGLDWLELIKEEPDAGLGNGGLGRLAACFLDSMATMELPATGCGMSTHVQAIHCRWLAKGEPGQLDPQRRPVGGRAPYRDGGSEARLLI